MKRAMVFLAAMLTGIYAGAQEAENNNEAAPEAPAAPSDQGKAAADAPTYYDIPMYAKFMVFVIDTSSSMEKDGPKNPTRLESAKKELTKAVKELDSDVSFALFAFNSSVTGWRFGKMTTASEKNKAEAIYWIENLRVAKGTNSGEALRRGLACDTRTETMFFLSDGKPSVGETDPQHLVDMVKHDNAKKRITINTIGIFTGGGVDGHLVQFMKDLAEKNGGVCKQVN
jgi:Mg-chelatase subunit ChlD